MNIPGINKNEFDHYLKRFREADYFAVIKAGGECLNGYLIEALRELHGLGLYPVFIHGGGKQIDDAMDAEGIKKKKIDGKRFSDERTMEIVGKVLEDVNGELVYKINQGGVYAEGLNKVFCVDGKSPEYGYVGNIIGMDKEKVDSCLQRNLIPIISSLGVDAAVQTYNQNADSAFRFSVEFLKPDKAVSLTPTGGVIKEGDIISEMNHDELLKILDSGHVDGGMKPKLEEIAKLVKKGFDVQVTSPEYLMLELFSEKGLGTYIKGLGFG